MREMRSYLSLIIAGVLMSSSMLAIASDTSSDIHRFADFMNKKAEGSADLLKVELVEYLQMNQQARQMIGKQFSIIDENGVEQMLFDGGFLDGKRRAAPFDVIETALIAAANNKDKQIIAFIKRNVKAKPVSIEDAANMYASVGFSYARLMNQASRQFLADQLGVYSVSNKHDKESRHRIDFTSKDKDSENHLIARYDLFRATGGDVEGQDAIVNHHGLMNIDLNSHVIDKYSGYPVFITYKAGDGEVIFYDAKDAFRSSSSGMRSRFGVNGYGNYISRMQNRLVESLAGSEIKTQKMDLTKDLQYRHGAKYGEEGIHSFISKQKEAADAKAQSTYRGLESTEQQW